MEEECSKQGYTVLYGNTSDDPQKDLTYTTAFLSKGVDVLVIIHSNAATPAQQKKLLELAHSTNTPLLAIDREFTDTSITTISVDRFSGAYEATKHLIQLGHTRIGCVTGIGNSNRESQRLLGYQKALHEFDIPYDEKLVYNGDFRAESGRSAFSSLWSQGITAVFACNDMMAMGIYLASRRANVNIPTDLSIVGFDNVFFSEYIYPPLTTVAQPLEEIGYEAAKQALLMASSKHCQPRTVLLQTSLIERESTAAPKIQI